MVFGYALVGYTLFVLWILCSDEEFCLERSSNAFSTERLVMFSMVISCIGSCSVNQAYAYTKYTELKDFRYLRIWQKDIGFRLCVIYNL